MPTEEKYVIDDAKDMDALFEVLAGTSIEKATASEIKDKYHILNIEKDDTGYPKFNQTVNERIREWVLVTVKDTADK